jgi:hypothetical protein
MKTETFCRPCERRDLEMAARYKIPACAGMTGEADEIPAFAGMTLKGRIH